LHSIHSVLLAFPDEARVYAGHGEPTTIGWNGARIRF
jgi:glyoxylase-like metal-dependent hydrolase (beta-lactamase superfamily II)